MMQMDLVNIPKRVKELREILDIAPEEMASGLSIDVAHYLQLESGESDIPISTLYEISAMLNVDFTTLLTGRTPKMDTYTVTREGNGAQVERYPGYDYSTLSFNFKGREMEPMLVNLVPEEEHPSLVSHSGQEFNYVLEGKVVVVIGKKEILLEKGDCIYFNPQLPHGQYAVDGPAAFLTVIKE